jgi:hypothetical protein
VNVLDVFTQKSDNLASHHCGGRFTSSFVEDIMGLNERRKIEELKTVTFPGRVKEIEEICGKAIPYEVDWASLADDMEGLNFIDNLSCHRLNMALRGICQDEIGKEAVRDGLKLIKLKNVKDKASMKLSFDAGVLEMHLAYALRTDGMYSDNEIQALLTKKL